MMSQKEEELLCLLSAPVVDLWKLREHALSEDGLVNGKYFKVLLQAVLPVVTTPDSNNSRCPILFASFSRLYP